MSFRKPDIAALLSDHIEHELQSRVEDILVKRFLEQGGRDLRPMVREAVQKWTLGSVEHMRNAMSLAEGLNIELVVTEKQEDSQ